MSWRVVVVSSNAKVDFKMDYLVVRTLNETRRIHISEIALLKAMEFRVDLEDLPPHEMLYEYLSLHNRMLKHQCIVLVHAKAFFSCEEMEQLYTMAQYKKWNLLLMESHAGAKLLASEQHRLYDVDLCELNSP